VNLCFSGVAASFNPEMREVNSDLKSVVLLQLHSRCVVRDNVSKTQAIPSIKVELPSFADY
jgi:hypothetical protein